MTRNGRKVDSRTIEKYLEAFMESYIVYKAKRYNIKGKQYLKTLEKYYVVDIGLRYMLLGSRKMNARTYFREYCIFRTAASRI